MSTRTTTAVILSPPAAHTGIFTGPRNSDTFSSVTCAVTTSPACSNSSETAVIGAIYNFCADYSKSSLAPPFMLPNNPPKNQTQLPIGLVCDGTRYCINGIQYTATCYIDQNKFAGCTSSTSSSNGGSSDSSSLANSPAFKTIASIIFVLLCLACCWKGVLFLLCFCWEGMSGIKENLADQESRDTRRHREQDLERENRRDEAVRMEANRVRREKELTEAFNQGVANRALREDKIKLALEKASDEITQKRHELKMREVERQMQLSSIVENSKDAQNQRLAQRFKTALALKAAKREEELKVSGDNIKVIESSIIENGNVVGTRQEILRERYAKTDAEAQELVGSVGNGLHQITLPSAS
ncbi:hypothetical protein BJ741DRAFT_323186 [Chytriomyces cf. hyalinus JEL632]|nr:hypothetical protein BJ741DRAFT_323186 [Chytriomyces cf. hyalinus JEL632]